MITGLGINEVVEDTTFVSIVVIEGVILLFADRPVCHTPDGRIGAKPPVVALFFGGNLVVYNHVEALYVVGVPANLGEGLHGVEFLGYPFAHVCLFDFPDVVELPTSLVVGIFSFDNTAAQDDRTALLHKDHIAHLHLIGKLPSS